jgi:hypothetical protein
VEVETTTYAKRAFAIIFRPRNWRFCFPKLRARCAMTWSEDSPADAAACLRAFARSPSTRILRATLGFEWAERTLAPLVVDGSRPWANTLLVRLVADWRADLLRAAAVIERGGARGAPVRPIERPAIPRMRLDSLELIDALAPPGERLLVYLPADPISIPFPMPAPPFGAHVVLRDLALEPDTNAPEYSP